MTTYIEDKRLSWRKHRSVLTEIAFQPNADEREAKQPFTNGLRRSIHDTRNQRLSLDSLRLEVGKR